MTLTDKLNAQRKNVAEFASALENLKTPPKYEPPSSEPLEYLKSLLAIAKDDRAEKLQAAETTLEHSRKVLAELGVEQATIDVVSASKAARSELQALSTEFNDLSARLAAAASLLQAEERLRPALAAERTTANPVGCQLLNALLVTRSSHPA